MKKLHLLLFFVLTASAFADGFKVESRSFKNDEEIPLQYTADGGNISPEILIQNVPQETKEFIIFMDDPDAMGTDPWVHWLLYRVPGDTREIPEGGGGIGVIGRNSWGKREYRGPQPPRGTGVHHYHIWVVALREPLQVFDDSAKPEVMRAAQGKIISTVRMTGIYKR